MAKSSSRRSQSRGRSQGRKSTQRSKSPKRVSAKQRAQANPYCPQQGLLNPDLCPSTLKLINVIATLIGTIGYGVMALYLNPKSNWGWYYQFTAIPSAWTKGITIAVLVQYALEGLVLFTRCDIANVVGIRYALLVTIDFISWINFGENTVALNILSLILVIVHLALLVNIIQIAYPSLKNNMWAVIAFSYLPTVILFPYDIYDIVYNIGQIALLIKFEPSVLIAWGVISYMIFLYDNFVLSSYWTRCIPGRVKTVMYSVGVLVFAIGNYVWLNSNEQVAISQLQSLVDGFRIVSVIYIILTVVRIVYNVLIIFVKDLNISPRNLVQPTC